MLNIVIPMAGLGSRFKKAGFPDPKPFIDIHGYPMVYHAIQSIGIIKNATYILIALKDHLSMGYDLNQVMQQLCINDYHIIAIDSLTRGAAETCLQAKDFINNKDELIVADCDTKLVWSVDAFLSFKQNVIRNTDAIVMTVTSNDPNYSYVKLINGKAVEFADKRIISNRGLTGFHYWKYGKDFVSAAEQLISCDIVAYKEYYMSAAHNMLLPHKTIIEYPLLESIGERQITLGTPWELHQYMNGQDARIK